jgi:hypothetical protein
MKAISGFRLSCITVAVMVSGIAAIVISSMPLSAQNTASPSATSPGQVTFSKDVAPILQRSCQNCHRPGAIAPMSLLTYQDARPWVRSIKAKVAQREMPPYYIDRNIGIQKFKDDPSLSDAEVATIVKWADSGAAQGNPADMPAARKFDDVDKWHLGTPDLVVLSPEHVVPAAGADVWLDQYSDSGLTEDRYIKAVEVKPASAASMKVLHHAHQYMVPASADVEDPFVSINGDESLNEYSLGKNADLFPEKSGRLIKAGSKIRFNVHYHSNGEQITSQAAVAMVFYPKGYVPKHVVHTDGIGTTSMQNLDIPGNASDVRADGYKHFDTAVKITAFQPHMHNRGKRECLEALYPDGRTETLNCANFNFGWGIVYNYEDNVAPVLPAGSFLHVINWHDNSSANRGNPEPRNWVGSGNRTIDEMAHSWVSWYALTDEEYKEEAAVRRAQQRPTSNQ